MHIQPANGIILPAAVAGIIWAMSSIIWAVSTCSLAPNESLYVHQVWSTGERAVPQSAIFAIFRMLKMADTQVSRSGYVVETHPHTPKINAKPMAIFCTTCRKQIKLMLFGGSYFTGAKCRNMRCSWAVGVISKTSLGMFRHSKTLLGTNKLFL